MYRLLFVLIAICFLPSVSWAQNAKRPTENGLWAETLAKQIKQFTCFFDSNGTLIIHPYPPEKPLTPGIPLKQFYLHPIIVSELGLENSKHKSLRQVLEIYERDREDLVKIASASSVPRATSSRGKEKLIDLAVTCDKELREIFDKKDFDRVRQIQLRWLIHRNGFWQCLTTKAFEQEFGLSLTAGKTEFEEQGKIARKLAKKEKELREQLVQRWLADLSDEQIAIFNRAWKELAKSYGCILRQYELQLDPSIKENEFDSAQLFGDWYNRPFCDSDAAGNLVLKKIARPEKDKHPSLSKLRTIMSLFGSQNFRRDVELVDEQVELANSIREEFLQRKREINHEFGQRLGIEPILVGMGEEQHLLYQLKDPQVAEKFYLALDKETDDLFDQYMDVLFPHQRQLLTDFNRSRQLRMQGPLADLLWGRLGERMELTDKQRRSIRERAKSTREWIRTESRKAYEDTINELIELAAPEDQRELRSILGKTPKDWSPNLYTFAYALFSENE